MGLHILHGILVTMVISCLHSTTRTHAVQVRPRVRSVMVMAAGGVVTSYARAGVVSTVQIRSGGDDTGPIAKRHLVVLVHGLAGSAADLSYLGEKLETDPTVLVTRVRCNEAKGLTFDGIANGASRIATEVRNLLGTEPALETISLVGNSLGGLYTRHLAADIYDRSSMTMLGLRPNAFVTIATPHLGVRRFTYLPTPRWAEQTLSGRVAGRTGEELFLLDGNDEAPPLVVRMGTDRAFLEPLRAFQTRRAYGE